MKANKKNITIWRAIYLNKIEDLDLHNFGCHWTKDEYYCIGTTEFPTNDISASKRKGEIQFLFKAKIAENLIDKKRTNLSNKEYPNESECVLKQNIKIEKVELIFPIQKTDITINTGNRID